MAVMNTNYPLQSCCHWYPHAAEELNEDKSRVSFVAHLSMLSMRILVQATGTVIEQYQVIAVEVSCCCYEMGLIYLCVLAP